LAGALTDIGPEVVHAQGMGIYAGAAVTFPVPHVVTAHGVFFREARFSGGMAGRVRGLLDSAFERYCARRVQNLIAISPYVEEELGRYARFPRIYRIENPVDNRFFDAQRTAQNQCTVLYAGRIIRRKGLLDLLMAIDGLRKSVPEIRLRVAGELESDVEYVDRCRAFVEQHGLDRMVHFLGALSTEDMLEAFAECTVLALPSYQETAPVVVAEAMASGRAVVATNTCGTPYMVEPDVTGILFEPGDVGALQDALRTLLTDAGYRESMQRAAKERAEKRFRPATVAGRTRQAYLEVAG
jgi:glycosyltransferase involved in cell wall biosynthesis